MRGYRGYGGVTEPVSAPGNGQRPRGVGVGEAGRAQPRRCPPSPGPEVTSLPPLAPPRRSSGAVPVPLPRGRPIRGGPPPARPRLRCHPLSSPPHPPAHGHVSPPGGEGGRAVPSRGRGLAVPRSGPALLSHGLPAARRRELCPHPAVPIPPPRTPCQAVATPPRCPHARTQRVPSAAPLARCLRGSRGCRRAGGGLPGSPPPPGYFGPRRGQQVPLRHRVRGHPAPTARTGPRVSLGVPAGSVSPRWAVRRNVGGRGWLSRLSW